MKKLLFALMGLAAVVSQAATIKVPTDQSTIADAIAAAQSGDEIVLETSGSPYTLAANVTVPSGVTLRGATGNRADVVIKSNSRVIYLNQANATLADLTVQDGYAMDDGPKMGIVQVMNASARCVNCRVTNCNLANSNSRGAIRITAGVVTNCLVDANYTKAARAYSVGIRQEGGTVVSTVIRDNYSRASAAAIPTASCAVARCLCPAARRSTATSRTTGSAPSRTTRVLRRPIASPRASR